MMADSPLEFVFKLATMSERELVGSLRAIAADRLHLDQPGLPPDSADTFAGALKALKALHLQNTRKSAEPASTEQADERSPSPVTSSPGPVRRPSYDQVREHFAAHEARLRKEALVTDSILERLYRERVSEPETEAQLLNLDADGSRAAGEFVVTNATEHLRRLSFVVRPGGRVDAEGWRKVKVGFSPDVIDVPADGEARVTVSVSWSAPLAGDLPFLIDIRDRGLRVGRIWTMVRQR